MPFVKLDTGILDSTLWHTDANTRVVFITMLTMAKSDGLVEATAPGIAHRANLPLEVVREALSVLEAPDEDSRSLEDEGRRIQRVDGGYLITNYLKYRDKRERDPESRREYMREYMRERRGKQSVNSVNSCKQSLASVSLYTEADAYTDINRLAPVDEDLWNEFLRNRKANKAKSTPRALKTLVNKIRSLHEQGYSPSDLIEEANTNGWKSVFPPKRQPGQPEQQPNSRALRSS